MKRLVLFLCVILYINTLCGQQKKQQLTESDYNLWSRPILHSVSPKGDWVSYSLNYASGGDTLFLKSPTKSFGFASGRNGRFIQENFWVCLSNDGLHIVNLYTSETRIIKGVNIYDYANKNLVCLSKNKGVKQLSVESLEGNRIFTQDDCTTFELSKTGNLVFNIYKEGHNTIIHFNSKLKKETLAMISNGNIDTFTWSKDENAITFVVKDDKANSLYYFDFKQKKLKKLDKMKIGRIHHVSTYNRPFFSDEGQVFFEVQEQPTIEKEDAVMIYNTADKWTYPMEKDSKGFHRLPKLAMWDSKEDQVQMVTDTLFPYCFLLSKQKQALVYNPKQYAPHNLKNEERDIYILDLKSGKKKLFLARQNDDYGPFSVSPSGKKTAVFKNGHWRIIRQEGVNDCIDCQMPYPVASPSPMNDNLIPEGFAGWSADEKFAVVYDQFDVWKINIETKKAVRLTNGREKNIIFRIKLTQTDINPNNYQLRAQQAIDFEKMIVIKAVKTDFTYSGFFTWSKSSGLTPIVWKNMRIDQFVNKGSETFAWTEETFEQPYEIYSKFADGKALLMGTTNVQHANFNWGKESKINYSALDGTQLTGTLYYPAGYDESKTYPLIVSVYQRQSPFYHQYIAPSLYYSDGFNIPHYLNGGYFVLLPDIVYRVGDPGVAATECILASIDAALSQASINPKKIGLIGHSYGGYETSFAITQTNRFTVAVAGAAPTNFISNYLSLGGPLGVPEAWRYEHFQGRMKKTLFEDMAGYIRNSPVFQAQNVNTPLLSWTGEIDDNVAPEQSIEFHLALRRLNKTNVMLIYKDEGHALLKRENCLDLTSKIKEWFDHYLKDQPIPKWSLPK
ncbi:prolyl oligopeptidase family serine peptidase [Flavobacterium plurextorum]|uniref:S9 family peptidase n=1 Tax=Flavobacterium plurextorum TaxID=1114867 RepID=UPI0037579267